MTGRTRTPKPARAARAVGGKTRLGQAERRALHSLGEVRTLDFTAPAQPRSYEFHRKFHKESLKGLLVVV